MIGVGGAAAEGAGADGSGRACFGVGVSARFGAGLGTGTAWSEAAGIMSTAAIMAASAATGHFASRRRRAERLAAERLMAMKFSQRSVLSDAL
jgi:hypothetical protein